MATAVLKAVGQLIIDYVKRSYQHDPFRIVLEGFLVAFALWYLRTRAYRPDDSKAIKLTPEEVDELVEEWHPEPLVSSKLYDELNDNGVREAWMEEDEVVRDLARPCGSGSDFLGLRSVGSVREAAKAAVREYGVGTCGPAGFYGTLDIHQALQDSLAHVFEAEAALVLAQGYSAIAGVIPAFCKRGDFIIADEAVSFAIQRGIQLSRSRVLFYRHLDAEHCLQLMQEVQAERTAKRGHVTRQFLICEGLFANTGRISPLPDLLKHANEYKWRVILDESLALGVLGNTGRGTCEHFGIAVEVRKQVIYVGALSGAVGAAGGFTAGARLAIDHQILSNQAYCYSASLPGLFAAAALEALRIMPPLVPELKAIIAAFDKAYARMSSDFALKGYIIDGDTGHSPLRFLHATHPEVKYAFEARQLAKLAHRLASQWQVAVRRVNERDERVKMRPAVRIGIQRGMPVEDFLKAILTCLPSP